MANIYVTSNLLTSIRNAAYLAAADADWDNARLLDFLNRAQRTDLTHFLMKVREGFLVASSDVAVTPTTTAVDIPSAAVGAKLLQVLKNSGDGWVPLNPRPEATNLGIGLLPSGAGDYWLAGTQIVFARAPDFATLRILYFRRMSQLVHEDDCCEISTVNTSTGIAVPALTPSNLYDATPTTYDIVKGTPHFETRGSVAGYYDAGLGEFILTVPLPTGTVAGDFICQVGTTPLVQAPPEALDWLVRFVAVDVLQSIADPRVKYAADRLAQLEQATLGNLAERVEGSDTPLINYSGPGWRRGGDLWRRW